jgi:hypothetical protein
MKTSIKLNLKTKKLKTLSKEQAEKVGGAADTGRPTQANAVYAYFPTYYTCQC